MTVAAELASLSSGLSASRVPPRLRAQATVHMLDVLGCGVAAVGMDASAHATAIATDQGGKPESSLLGSAVRVPASLAALANGTRCHALDFDDTHEAGICHASTVVAPAAIAVGEAAGSAGADTLDAYILGCEVALRVAVVAADGLYARGFHPTGVCGAFGAAAAASRLLHLDAETTTNALGIVGSFASGLLEYLSDGSATKPLHAGWAARAGVDAATLAAAGAEGPASVLEGRFGLLASHAGAATAAAGMTDGLGDRWEMAALAIKAYPMCHFSHSSTWAVAELVREHGLTPDDVEEIVVRIPDEGRPLVLDPLEEKVSPKTAYDAKFSLPYSIAHHLAHGEAALSAFDAVRIKDERILELARRVRYEPLAAGEERRGRFAGGARVITRSGDVYDRFVPDPPGSPGNPLDDRSVSEKFRANAELATDSEGAQSLVMAVRAITDASSLEAITRPLREAQSPTVPT